MEKQKLEDEETVLKKYLDSRSRYFSQLEEVDGSKDISDGESPRLSTEANLPDESGARPEASELGGNQIEVIDASNGEHSVPVDVRNVDQI